MRIFKDLEMVEQLGSEIPRILEYYGKESFNFSDNFLRMTFATKVGAVKDNNQIEAGKGGVISSEIGGANDENPKLTKRQKEVLRLIAKNSAITYNEIAETLGVNESAVGKHINAIKDKGFLERKEGTRGYWEVNIEGKQ